MVEGRGYEWHEENGGGPALFHYSVRDLELFEARGEPYWVSGDDTARRLAGRVYWE